MAKKKKQNRNRKKTPSVNKPKDAAALMQEQQEALLAGRGRRASALGEKIFADESVEESVRLTRFAVGHEAYLRELQAKGHAEQLRAKVKKLLHVEPRIAELWALSFQVYLGLVDAFPACLDDREWVARLRLELVDPSDLCGIDAGGLGEQAQCVLDVWAKIETGGEEVLEPLKSIGRRSPLVDWRLFLQVLVAVRRNDLPDAELTLGRMQAGVPARDAAEKIIAGYKTLGGAVFRRLKTFERVVVDGSLKSSDYPKLQSLVKYLLSQKRPGLALMLVAMFGRDIQSQYEANHFFSPFERMTDPFFNLKRIYLRLSAIMPPHAGLLEPDSIDDIRNISWSESELVIVWSRLFSQAREEWGRIISDHYPEEIEDFKEMLLHPLLDECPRLIRTVPHCREFFKFWVWGEEELQITTGEALKAYIEAFPEDPDVLKLAVLRLSVDGSDAQSKRFLNRFKGLAKPEEITALEQAVLTAQIQNAFKAKDAKRVEALATEYSGEDLLERMRVAFMRWRLASRGGKRKCGEDLVAFKLPWLVFYVAVSIEEEFKFTALPAGMKRALGDDPVGVVQSFLELVRLDEQAAMKLDDFFLSEWLCKALEAASVPVDITRDALVFLLTWLAEPEEVIWEADGFVGALGRLLKGSADDQAAAIVLRMLAIYRGEGMVGAKKSERSFRVAWSLAEREETRRLILQTHATCMKSRGKMNKKPATRKMIDAELKIQRKFKELDQQEEYYFEQQKMPSSGRGYNPFDGVDPDELEKIFEPDLGEGCDGDCKNCELCPDDGPVIDIPPPPPPPSVPYKFSKHAPLMEFDFEQVAAQIRQTTRGKHRKDAAKIFKKLVEESRLSEKAKARLMKIQQQLVEGV